MLATDFSMPLVKVFGELVVGLSLALLASLCTWPFALSTATLLEHNRARPIYRWFLSLTAYLSGLPLLLFVYVYIEVIGQAGFASIQKFWTLLFASPNFLTQSISFALTLLLYPLVAMAEWGGAPTIDHFYRKILEAVIDFAEVGIVASVVVIGLFLFIFPKMVLKMRALLRDDENVKSSEIIKSIGGTSWESIHLTVMQSMKNSFTEVIAYCTRVCFFEGLITYTLLHLFFVGPGSKTTYWGTSLTSMFLDAAIEPSEQRQLLHFFAGLLSVSYLGFILFEKINRRSRDAHV